MSDTNSSAFAGSAVHTDGRCGCCEGAELATPMVVHNRHGLSAIDYRVGDYHAFREAMQANLSNRRALDGLTTRADDDYTIALLDAWAQVADVLTFYQERIANEGFLATATERRSLVWLASALGYVPSAGVAAAGLVSFEMETAPGAPDAAIIPEGLAVQSLPGPGEEPQTYETTAEIEARPRWNAMAVRTIGPAGLSVGQTRIGLAGAGLRLGVGDGLLIVGRARENNPNSGLWELRRVVSTEIDQSTGTTWVDLDQPLSSALSSGSGGKFLVTEPWLKVYAMRSRLSVFGHNAMDWDLLPQETKDNYLEGLHYAAVSESKQQSAGVAAGAATQRSFQTRAQARSEAGARAQAETQNLTQRRIEDGGDGDTGQWPGFLTVFDDNTVQLDGHHPDIVIGSWMVVSSPGQTELYQVESVQETAETDFGLTGKVTEVTLSDPDNHDGFDKLRRSITVFAVSERMTLAPIELRLPVEGVEVPLADSGSGSDLDPGLEPGRQLLVVGPRAMLQLADDLPLDPDDGGAPVTLTVESVVTVTGPSTDLGGGQVRWPVETGDGRLGTIVADRSQLDVFAAPEDTPAVVEPAIVAALEPDGRLRLTSPLVHVFDRAGMRIHANVAPVTHGASTTEVLGGGRASARWQRFRLRQKPLTFVPGGEGGATTTLEIRVNEVLWTEVRSLALAGPGDRVYQIEVDDDGEVSVLFGDGTTGARLPTGADNIVANYRVGSGRDGLVNADQLTLLVDRPLGVKAVTNPLAPDGAADPEPPEALRSALPGTVKSFDRLVSLLDHQDFALAFPGVAKAAATWLWTGSTRVIQVTVAGDDGDQLAADGTVLTNLAANMAAAAGHFNAIRLAGHEPLPFTVKAGLFIDPAYETEAVLDRARAALLADFAFDRRRFGQPVSISDLSLSLHVEGVLGVDVDELSLSIDELSLSASTLRTKTTTLVPQPARMSGNEILAAQLLVIDGPSTVLESKS